jgi:hypothetical protein
MMGFKTLSGEVHAEATPTPHPSPQGGGEIGNAGPKSPSPLWGGVRGGGAFGPSREDAPR